MVNDKDNNEVSVRRIGNIWELTLAGVIVNDNGVMKVSRSKLEEYMKANPDKIGESYDGVIVNDSTIMRKPSD